MSTPKSNLYVITAAKKLAECVLQASDKWSKKFCYSYLFKIENVLLRL